MNSMYLEWFKENPMQYLKAYYDKDVNLSATYIHDVNTVIVLNKKLLAKNAKSSIISEELLTDVLAEKYVRDYLNNPLAQNKKHFWLLNELKNVSEQIDDIKEVAKRRTECILSNPLSLIIGVLDFEFYSLRDRIKNIGFELEHDALINYLFVVGLMVKGYFSYDNQNDEFFVYMEDRQYKYQRKTDDEFFIESFKDIIKKYNKFKNLENNSIIDFESFVGFVKMLPLNLYIRKDED